jgi:hypothetical protein
MFARLEARSEIGTIIGAVMVEATQYKKYADECRGWAATTKNPEHKKQLLKMAAAWDTVARQQESALVNTTDE